MDVFIIMEDQVFGIDFYEKAINDIIVALQYFNESTRSVGFLPTT